MCMKVQVYVDCSFKHPTSLYITPLTPSTSASYRPHSASHVEFTISRNRRRRATRVAHNRAVLRTVPTIVHGVRSLMNFNMQLQHRVAVQEQQQRTVTHNLHQVLRCLAGWRACVRSEDACPHGWGLHNAVDDIQRHSACISDSDDNKSDREPEVWIC